jgi:ubiquinone/menaquinone biosynthesis C-methylase UbiE
MLLADELAETRGAQPLRERRDLACTGVRGIGEEVTHGLSMLLRVSGSVADTWSGASYERIAETFAPIHDRVVATLGIEPGTRILDVACGTGGVALRAARAGARVTGIDISADQLAKARRAAEAEGLEIRWDEGDCQELPYGDAEFDAVASVFGAIFAPDQERTAAELARVCRGGGRLALTAWQTDEWSELHTKAGRPQYDVDARKWGEEERVRALLGDAFELELQGGAWRMEAESGEELWEILAASMPPLRAWLASVDEAARAHAKDVYVDFLGSGVLERRFVLVLGLRR